MRPTRWPAAIAILTTLCLLVACAQSAADEPKAKPAQVEEIPGSKLKRLVLQPRAVERLAIQTGPVTEQTMVRPGSVASTPTLRLVIPYSAVIYDPSGATWTYVNGQPGTYLREPSTIDYVDGGTAVLWAGPPAGAPVVTVGAALLYGEETGIGK
jgi:hypothetical protein